MWSAVSNGIGMVGCLPKHELPKVISATGQIATKILKTRANASDIRVKKHHSYDAYAEVTAWATNRSPRTRRCRKSRPA